MQRPWADCQIASAGPSHLPLQLSSPGRKVLVNSPPLPLPPSVPCSSVTFDLLPRGALPSPMQQCWQINAWALLAVGALLPLLVLRRWERTARRRWDAEQKCSAAGSQPVETPPSSSCAPAEGHGQEAEAEAGAGEDPQLQESAPLRPPGWWLLEAWLAGALLWQAAGLGAALLAPAA